MEHATKLTAIDNIPSLSDREFARFQSLIYRETGIYFSPPKRTLLVGRLAKRLRALGLKGFSDYYQIVARDAAEREQLIDCICTNETHFFREKRHYEFLADNAIPNWMALGSEAFPPRRIRVWSAGCSTGEEPFSVAMFLLDRFPAERPAVDVLASDISSRALAKAEQGVWPITKSEELSEHYRKRYMLKGTGEFADLMKAAPELRAHVRFQRLNLNTEAYPSGKFDLILCCNVLIYFDAESKRRVLERMVRHLTPAGYLMLGHAETLHGVTDHLRAVAPTIYTAPGNAAATLAFERSRFSLSHRARAYRGIGVS